MRVLLLLTFTLSATLLYARTASAEELQYFVVIGSYQSKNVASDVVSSITAGSAGKNNFYEPKEIKIIEASVDGHINFRVVNGPFEEFSRANALRQTLADANKPAWIMSLLKVKGESPKPGEDQESVFIPSTLLAHVIPSESALSETPNISKLTEVRINEIEMPVTVLKSEIEILTRDYMGRTVSVEELINLKNSVNKLFVLNGYINSGVLIPDQQINAGVLVFDVIEGNISRLRISSQLHNGYVRKRLNITRPFNLTELQTSLKLS